VDFPDDEKGECSRASGRIKDKYRRITWVKVFPIQFMNILVKDEEFSITIHNLIILLLLPENDSIVINLPRYISSIS